MTRRPDFVARRFGPVRALWRSRLWVGLVLFLGLAWSLQTRAFVPVYVQVLAGLGAVVILWRRGPMAMSMWRAGTGQHIVQARVTGTRESSIRLGGIPLRSARWIDAEGQTGESRPVESGRAPRVGSTVIIYKDRVSGRGWWEEDL